MSDTPAEAMRKLSDAIKVPVFPGTEIKFNSEVTVTAMELMTSIGDELLHHIPLPDVDAISEALVRRIFQDDQARAIEFRHG